MNKTVDKSRITALVFAAVDELNQQLRKAQRLEKSPTTPISGTSATLDSLGLLNLIVQVEQQLEQEFQVSVTLADDAVMAQENTPFQTLGTLTDYISAVLEKKLNG